MYTYTFVCICVCVCVYVSFFTEATACGFWDFLMYVRYISKGITHRCVKYILHICRSRGFHSSIKLIYSFFYVIPLQREIYVWCGCVCVCVCVCVRQLSTRGRSWLIHPGVPTKSWRAHCLYVCVCVCVCLLLCECVWICSCAREYPQTCKYTNAFRVASNSNRSWRKPQFDIQSVSTPLLSTASICSEISRLLTA